MHSSAVSTGHSNAFSTGITPGLSSSDMEKNGSAGSIPRIHGFGLGVIALTSVALALATASECQSVLHRPSLYYGLVLWAWWGCIAGAIWTTGFRKPIILGLSPVAIIVQVVIGCLLGIVHLLLLGSLGFINAAHPTALAVWTSLLNINRFGIEILVYGFVLGMIGIVQFQMRAAGCNEISGVAKAAFPSAVAGSPNAAGAAFSLQHA
jgi:hypothetical protein